MSEELSDWKVQIVLDRKALVDDITKLVQILARGPIYYTVAASSREAAIRKTEEYLHTYLDIGPAYVRAMHPRRLPT